MNDPVKIIAGGDSNDRYPRRRFSFSKSRRHRKDRISFNYSENTHLPQSPPLNSRALGGPSSLVAPRWLYDQNSYSSRYSRRIVEKERKIGCGLGTGGIYRQASEGAM
jgi:hypothetical protein